MRRKFNSQGFGLRALGFGSQVLILDYAQMRQEILLSLSDKIQIQNNEHARIKTNKV